MASLPARELVLAFFHAASDRSLDVATLVAATGFLGLTGNATRVALSRLGSEGWIVRDDRGRYRLRSERAEKASGLASYRGIPSLVTSWKGTFIGCLFTPSRKEALPAELERLGFRTPSPGFAVRPDNLKSGVDLLEARLGPARLISVDATGEGDATERWSELWDGAALTKAYARLHERIKKSRARLPKLSDEMQLVETWGVAQASIVELEQDPLLPDGWVDAAARAQVVQELAAYDRDARLHWMKMIPGLQLEGSPGSSNPWFAEAS
jgi:phenylacetic acid degradation operon negative regulatory protein